MPAPLKLDSLFTPNPLQAEPPQGVPSAVSPSVPALPASQALPTAAPASRGFADSSATRHLIYDNVLSAARNIKPVSNARYRMELHGVDYEDPDHVSIQDQKQAVLTGQTLSRRLRGTWRMFDQVSNEPVDEKRVTLANVPHMTHRGTFVLGGTEYTLAHQMRLRAGIYHRVKENGEIEAHANIMPGKGLSHRYFLEPETGVFKVNVGQANLPLTPLLHAMGVTDKELRQSWGNELFAANSVKDDTQVIDKLYMKLAGRKADPRTSHMDKATTVANTLMAMELDPEVTKRTLGGPHTHLTKEAVLATTKKLLAIGRGEQEPDDRDHLAFQHFMGPEDLMAERFNRAGTALNQALWRATHKGSLQAMQAGLLTKHVQGAILDSGLGQPLEEINPADVFDQQTRVTRLGYGGIPSIDSVPDEARAVQPSHTGYIDLIRAPESEKVGVDSRVAWTARKGPNGQILAPMLDPKTGKQSFKTPQEIADLTVAFPGPEWDNNEALVPAQVKGRTRNVPRSQVDLVMPHAENWFSPLNNLIPNKATIKGQRASMASRFIAQALPLDKAESPLVRSAVPGTNSERSFEEEYGKHMGAVHAKDIGGRVASVDNQFITVKYADGTEEKHEIYDNFPYNRKSVTGDTRIIVRKPDNSVWEGPIGDYNYETGDSVVSVNPLTYCSDWRLITGYLKHANDKRLFLVRTRSGRQVTVTEDHSLVEMSDEGWLVPVYPRDCVIGKTRLPVALVPAAEVTGIGLQVNQLLRRGILAGLYLSEGHCPPTQPGLVCIAVQDDERAADVLKLLTSLDLKAYRNGGNVQFTDHSVCSWLLDNFGSYSHGKYVPGEMLAWPRRFREGLIQGYMGGDGCLWADGNGAVQVMAVSVSQRLRDSLVDVLASLGIFTTKFDAPRQHLSPQWRDGYGFRVLSSHLGKLNSEWFFYRDREEKFRSLTKVGYRSSSFELVPVPRKARKLLYAGFGGAEIPRYVYKTAHLGAVAKHRLRGVTGPFGQWAESDVLWDVVDEIIEVTHQEWVYDLEVGGVEVFAVNNGLLVHNTFLHNTPMVKPGDPVKPGQLLAKSNYTDDKGHVALGLNARVAYLPFRGLNYEDAFAVSESFAKRLSSEHMYQHQMEWEDKHRKGKNAYVSIFPATYDKKMLDNMDDEGVIKPGTVVKHNQPLVLAARERDLSHKQVHSAHKGSFQDQSLIWEHHADGIVTDVAKTKKGVVVAVKSLADMQMGDKMSGRYGDKGVISSIIPDHEMPVDAQGKPFEVLANPTGIISRTNPGQVAEAGLGKIAMKTGKPYLMEDFNHKIDVNDHVEQELKKHGLESTETVVDPTTGRKIPGVLTGMRFYMKLHHTSESKGQGRGLGGYTAEDTPARGGAEGSKRLALMDVNALLSHGACFMGSVNVLTEQGHLEISKIVGKRLPVRVACADTETGEVVYRPVVDWLCRSVPTKELMVIETFARTGNGGIRGSHRAIRCTRGHEFYTPAGKTQAFYLSPGDYIYTPGTKLLLWQEQMVTGSLMGDGYCSHGHGLSMCHGHAQRGYLDWKFARFSNLTVSEPKEQKLSVGSFAKKPTSRFTLRQHPQVTSIADEFYGGDGCGAKQPPPGIVARMGWVGVGIWFADDGGCVASRKTGKISGFRFHTCAFSQEAVERLAVEMREFTGLEWQVILQNGKYPILHLGQGGRGGDQIAQWVEMLRPYLPPDLAYKLRVPHCGWSVEDLQPPSGTWLELTTVKSVAPYIPMPYEDNLVYNITVEEHHNYIVHGVLVGNTEVLRDAKLVRGQKNQEYWASYMAGFKPPTPAVPYTQRKFIEQLKGSGINVVRKGTEQHIMPMTGKQVDALTENRELQNMETVDWKTGLQPKRGGLFDQTLTGGHGGNRWSYIKLHEPMPNPVMEDGIKRLLDLTGERFENVLSGKEPLAGQTGPRAIQKALEGIDVDQMTSQCLADVRGGKKTARDAAIRKLHFLQGAKKQGIHPSEWMLDKVPVLPPSFRPVSVMQQTGNQLIADVNYLYKELWDANSVLKDSADKVDDTSEERLNVYNSFKAVTGLGDPVQPKNKERQVKGLLQQIFGSSPKFGTVQQKLLGTPVDLVGRAVVVPNPDLTMDEVGLPENRAWSVYSPFIVRRLVRRGVGRVEAIKAVKDQSSLARTALVEEMDERPVLVNRAPVLHKYGLMAFKPKLVKGDVMHISPVVVGGFGMDFDGDASNYHVPATDEARDEALSKMLPSKNLLSASQFKVHYLPRQEYTGGLYSATKKHNNKKERTFRNEQDVMQAVRRGDLDLDHPIHVLES